MAEILRNTLKNKEKAGFFTEKLQKVKIRGRFGKEKRALGRGKREMDIVVKIKPKGMPWDGYEWKTMEEIKGISDLIEKRKRDRELSGQALAEIENKILDAIFNSELDIPLYILAMECLGKALEESLNSMGSMGVLMKVRLEDLRSHTDIGLIAK